MTMTTENGMTVSFALKCVRDVEIVEVYVTVTRDDGQYIKVSKATARAMIEHANAGTNTRINAQSFKAEDGTRIMRIG